MSGAADDGVLLGGHTPATVTDQVGAIVLTRPPGRAWIAGFALSFAALMLLLLAIAVLLVRGIGVWGVNVPVAWGFAITNFVWWIGIGHAGTLISAILLLMRQDWRTSINRFAEAMTIFAVACAGLFPLLHLGRPFLFYWLLPYPDTMGLWPQWRSPLVWDVFAVTTYFTISLLFWYLGLVPDLASLRDAARSRFAKVGYGLFALGWRGQASHWKRYQTTYLLLAGLATPLVVSVHSIVSLDFTAGIVPGWHSTIFPPYFVAGAIYSGFAMVLTLAIPLRRAYGLQDFITLRHLDNSAKVMLAMGLVVGYGYLMEAFTAWHSGVEAEMRQLETRATGPYAPVFWTLIACNLVVVQSLWSSRVRRSPVVLFVISLVLNVAMWLERFVIVIVSLHRDHLASSWDLYVPTRWDWATLVGSLGLFFALLFVFVRLLPLMSMSELRELVHAREAHRP